MTKKLRIDSRGLVDDKDLNVNVVTNSAGHKARRVKLHDGTIVWEVQAPDHLWNFESESGDFIDEVNEATLSDTEITTRVDGLTSQLGQAIELDAGVTVLSSKPYPVYAENAVEITSLTVNSIDLYKYIEEYTTPSEAVEVTSLTVNSINLAALVEEYSTSPEAVEVTSLTVNSINLAALVEEYTMPAEAVEVTSLTVNSINLEAYVIEHELTEAVEVTSLTVNSIDLSPI